MDVSRRKFFKICAGGMAGTTAAALGFEGDKLDALKEAFKPSCTEIVEVTTAENFS